MLCNQNMNNKEFTGGFASGVVQVLVTQPLSSLMNLRQNNNSNQKINFRKLYKGTLPTLTNSAITTGSIFYGEAELRKYTNSMILSSSIMGFINSLITSPFENLRIQRLNNIKIIYSVQRMYRGLPLYSARETIAWSLYISSYNYLKEKEIHPLISGGFAGWLSWFGTYPIDVLKTRIQSNLVTTYKKEFVKKNLWKGFGICSIRAIIANSIGFYTYEYFVSNKKIISS